MEWYIWIALGVICMILEVFSPAFFFFSLGVGAIVAGFFPFGVYVQLIVFAIATSITFFFMKRFAKAVFRKDRVESNVYALVGKKGTVTKEITPQKVGAVKVESEEWRATASAEEETIPIGSIIKVVAIDGNKVIVVPQNKEE
ncbi:MAG: NfeD family protein [Candidatus Cloacimonetes bacterium]|nr:NfeD family protein [Candidatus Cloacimonadota bacterium]